MFGSVRTNTYLKQGPPVWAIDATSANRDAKNEGTAPSDTGPSKPGVGGSSPPERSTLGKFLRFSLLAATCLLAGCSGAPEALLGIKELKSNVCTSLVVKPQSFIDDRYALCRLQQGVSPRSFLPEPIAGARETRLRDALARYKLAIRSYENDDTTWFVLAESPIQLEAACASIRSAETTGACFWQLNARNLGPDPKLDPVLTELLTAVSGAGLKDGDVFLEATSLSASNDAYTANEYIKVTIKSGVPSEISWHDVENVKQWSPAWAVR